MPYLPILAATILAGLGTIHVVYTVHNLVKPPRYFAPRDAALLAAMQKAKLRLAPHGRDYWRALLGFHFSHSIGVLLFALLILIAQAYPIAWLRPLLVAVGAIYSIVAWQCWFIIPLLGCAAATLLLVVGWAL